MPGTPGTSDEPSRVLTASARRRPACTIGSTDGGVPKVTWVSPATTDWIAGPPPRNGIDVICTFATCRNSAPPRCGAEPLPAVA